MSIEAMVYVWKKSPNKQGTLLLELALADHADAHGECYPSIAKLAEKCRMDERHVRRTLRQLEKQGILVVLKNAGPNGVNKYRLSYKNVKGGQNVTPDKMSGGGQNVRGTNRAEGEDKSDKIPVKNVPQTIIEPSVEPSIPPNPQGGKVGKRKKSVGLSWDETCKLFTDSLPAFWVDAEFAKAVNNFHGHRAERGKPWTERSILTAISDFKAWGVEKSIRSMKDSITGGWTGLFEPRTNGKHAMASATPPADPYEKYKNGF